MLHPKDTRFVICRHDILMWLLTHRKKFMFRSSPVVHFIDFKDIPMWNLKATIKTTSAQIWTVIEPSLR